MKRYPGIRRLKINLPGGIVSIGKLYTLLTIFKEAALDELSFGNRQQLVILATDKQYKLLDLLLAKADVQMEWDADDYPNIISSYVADEVFANTSWLSEGVYKDILDTFHYQPQLKINIVDRLQNLVPFFTGNFNFISSDISNYWYLCIRFPKTNQLFHWPTLIYSDDIAELSRVMEWVIMSEHHFFYDQSSIDGNRLVDRVSRKMTITTQPYLHPLEHTDFQLPFYEGINAYAREKLWLGIYRRNEIFTIDFLTELCQVCLDTRIGQLYTTPWKSILVKNIAQSDRKNWSILLNKYRINVRHAANELNWQLEDRCKETLQLKRTLVKAFDDDDLRTSKLCFAIKTRKQTGLFGSIVIQQDTFQHKPLYTVMYTENFNPNNKQYITFGQTPHTEELARLLIQLCNHYYGEHSAYTTNQTTRPKAPLPHQKSLAIYQCARCQTQYDPRYGDPWQNIPEGTAFTTLTNYHCSVCEAPQETFVLL